MKSKIRRKKKQNKIQRQKIKTKINNQQTKHQHPSPTAQITVRKTKTKPFVINARMTLVFVLLVLKTAAEHFTEEEFNALVFPMFLNFMILFLPTVYAAEPSFEPGFQNNDTDIETEEEQEEIVEEIEEEKVEQEPPTSQQEIPTTSQNKLTFIDYAENGDIKNLALLLEEGQDINALNERGESALLAAVTRNDTETLKFLLAEGADPNTYTYIKKGKFTALHAATQKNTTEAAKLLIKYGANINAVDHHGETPLLWAVYSNNLPLVKFLIKNNAITHSVKGEITNAPLHAAASNGHIEIATYFITELNARIDELNEYLATPLSWAVERNQIEMVQFLLMQGADPNAMVKGNESALQLAAEKGNVKIIEALLNGGAGINFFNHNSENSKPPLLHAICNLNLEAAEYLIKKGANVDLMVEQHFIVHHAVHFLPEILPALLPKSKYINFKGRQGLPIDIAYKKNNVSAFVKLMQFGAYIRHYFGGEKSEIDILVTAFWNTVKLYETNDPSAEMTTADFIKRYPELEDRLKFEQALVFKNQKNSKAKETLEDLAQKYPNNIDIHLALGEHHFSVHNFEAAGKNFEAALNLFPDNEDYASALTFSRHCINRSYLNDFAEDDYLKSIFQSKIHPEIFAKHLDIPIDKLTQLYPGPNFSEAQAKAANEKLDQVKQLIDDKNYDAANTLLDDLFETVPDGGYFSQAQGLLWLQQIRIPGYDTLKNLLIAQHFSIVPNKELLNKIATTTKEEKPGLSLQASELSLYHTIDKLRHELIVEKSERIHFDFTKFKAMQEDFFLRFNKRKKNATTALDAQLFQAMCAVAYSLFSKNNMNQAVTDIAISCFEFMKKFNPLINFAEGKEKWKKDWKILFSPENPFSFSKNAEEMLSLVNNAYNDFANKAKKTPPKGRRLVDLVIPMSILIEIATGVFAFFKGKTKKAPIKTEEVTKPTNKKLDILKLALKDLVDISSEEEIDQIITFKIKEFISLTGKEASDKVQKFLIDNPDNKKILIDTAKLKKELTDKFKTFDIEINFIENKITFDLKNSSLTDPRKATELNNDIVNALALNSDKFLKYAALQKLRKIEQNQSINQVYQISNDYFSNYFKDYIFPRLEKMRSLKNKVESNVQNYPEECERLKKEIQVILRKLTQRENEYKQFSEGALAYCHSKNPMLHDELKKQNEAALNLISAIENGESLAEKQTEITALEKDNEITSNKVITLINIKDECNAAEIEIDKLIDDLNSKENHLKNLLKKATVSKIAPTIPLPKPPNKTTHAAKPTANPQPKPQTSTEKITEKLSSSKKEPKPIIPQEDAPYLLPPKNISLTTSTAVSPKEKPKKLTEMTAKKLTYLRVLINEWNSMSNLEKHNDPMLIKVWQYNLIRLMLRISEAILQIHEEAKHDTAIQPDQIALLRNFTKYIALPNILSNETLVSKNFNDLITIFNQVCKILPEYWIRPLESQENFKGALDLSQLFNGELMADTLRTYGKNIDQNAYLNLLQNVNTDFDIFIKNYQPQSEEAKLYFNAIIMSITFQGAIIKKLQKIETTEEIDLEKDDSAKGGVPSNKQEITLLSLLNPTLFKQDQTTPIHFRPEQKRMIKSIRDDDVLRLCKQICNRISHLVYTDEFKGEDKKVLIQISEKISKFMPSIIKKFSTDKVEEKKQDGKMEIESSEYKDRFNFG